MHHREAHKSIAVTKQVSQTCSLTPHHYHKRPPSLKIPAAAIWLLQAGNNCFSNAVRILPFRKYCICTGQTQILQTQLQPSTQNLEQARFPGRGMPALPSPRRVRSLCSSRWGRTGRRCTRSASTVSPRDGGACRYPDEAVLQMLCASSQQHERRPGQICHTRQCEPWQQQNKAMWDGELACLTNNDTNQEQFQKITELLSPLHLHAKGNYLPLKMCGSDMACIPQVAASLPMPTLSRKHP